MSETRADRPKLTVERTVRPAEAAKLLGVSRATFYRLPFFRTRKVRISERAVGYLESDIAMYQSIRRGA